MTTTTNVPASWSAAQTTASPRQAASGTKAEFSTDQIRDSNKYLPITLTQCSPLSLVQECRASALIGRELHSVATPALLCHKEPARASKAYFVCPSLVLYGIRIGGFHAQKGSIIGASNTKADYNRTMIDPLLKIHHETILEIFVEINYKC